MLDEHPLEPNRAPFQIFDDSAPVPGNFPAALTSRCPQMAYYSPLTLLGEASANNIEMASSRKFCGGETN
jgi:hypothetical protein